MADFNGLEMGMGNLARLSKAKTRSISAENFKGEKGKAGMSTDGGAASSARDLGIGWKVSPFVVIQPGETFTFADIDGPGIIQSMWLSGDCAKAKARYFILRIYWDGQETPSVECPVGDFFASGWAVYNQVSSLPVTVTPNNGLSCFWPMPFRKKCRMTLENRFSEKMVYYYQVNYALTDVPADSAYFHAQFRRTNPLPYKEVYTIVDGIKGQGHYVGTAMSWGVNNNGWWGEGEIKFYMDGDKEFPTIAGTGTEDYFLGCYNFDVNGQYTAFTTPYSGMSVIRPDGTYRSQMRFSLYRWHIMDPVRFEKDLKVTIQALGWRDGGRYLPNQDDIASVAYWYQTLPTPTFPKLPDQDHLEII